MGENLIFDLVRQSLWIAVRMSAPLLAAALLAGVLIGLFQALTSVQEMTLTFVPKIGLMLAVFWVSMSFMTSVLAGFFTDGLLPLIAGGG
ncbi:flagellar biosynthetic protein FliQ [Paracoccus isoporae]|uniref:Flagellar biosynthetic protein FliQ n=1 Tax=Paracoccus isoporae TaxID=591205 RepID=A0A1G7CWK6_9RHOB|nr:flagellar biosynthetic protein FliQ [Paracoccus isoporae]SDE43631.1 flagellar biosynthetic protein FliQ [Paracoccus isoporae]